MKQKREGGEMKTDLRALVAAGALLAAIAACGPAFAQKQGGILRVPHFDSPASMSLLEESTVAVNRPMMGVFNNLVMYKQDVPQNSLKSIVPDLATGWAWNEEGTELTFPLRQGIKWHDGKPFTAADVKCTWDLLAGKSSEKLRINPRKGWYSDLAEVTTNGDYEVTFHLKRPQPSFLAVLAAGWSPVYPCHVSPREMRQHPIGTGPFKFVEFKPKPVDHGDPEPGLLESRAPLSRRDRMDDHQGSVDANPGVCRRKGGPALRSDDPATEGHQEPAAGRDLRCAAGECQPQPARQP